VGGACSTIQNEGLLVLSPSRPSNRYLRHSASGSQCRPLCCVSLTRLMVCNNISVHCVVLICSSRGQTILNRLKVNLSLVDFTSLVVQI
jgi:hypothetical protein